MGGSPWLLAKGARPYRPRENRNANNFSPALQRVQCGRAPSSPRPSPQKQIVFVEARVQPGPRAPASVFQRPTQALFLILNRGDFGASAQSYRRGPFVKESKRPFREEPNLAEESCLPAIAAVAAISTVTA